jgi:hypothetical protein
VVAVLLCLLPIVFLVLVTVVRRLLLPTNISLPVAAAMLAFIRWGYRGVGMVCVWGGGGGRGVVSPVCRQPCGLQLASMSTRTKAGCLQQRALPLLSLMLRTGWPTSAARRCSCVPRA